MKKAWLIGLTAGWILNLSSVLINSINFAVTGETIFLLIASLCAILAWLCLKAAEKVDDSGT